VRGTFIASVVTWPSNCLDGPVACGGGVAQPRQFGFAKLAWLATPPPHWLLWRRVAVAVWRGRTHSTLEWSG